MNSRKIFGLVLLAILISVCILYGDGPVHETEPVSCTSDR